MSASEFTLNINNPEEPKILCVGNNPDRQNIYGAALGLYNSRIVKLINKKGQLKSSVIIDELYNPQNEMFAHFQTKRIIFKNETQLFKVISHTPKISKKSTGFAGTLYI